MNTVIETILSRRSIRDYRPEVVTDEEIELILNAGLFAPSAMNHQSWHFTVIQNQQVIEKIVEKLGRNPFYNAKTLILAFGQESCIEPVIDPALAMENMFLAAHSIGIGTCWVNCVKTIFQSPEGKAFQKELGVSEDYNCIGSMIMGYPNEVSVAKPRKEGTVNWVK